LSNTYNLFISHSWAYSDAYQKLINLLDARAYFIYNNHSVPKDDPIHTNGTDRQLREAIKNKMSGCHVVLIMGGVYSTYSKWIQKEIDIAKNGFMYKKPILAIKPWAQERLSTVVADAADDIAGWNTESIVSKIRALG